jgi:hypothetical protein
MVGFREQGERIFVILDLHTDQIANARSIGDLQGAPKTDLTTPLGVPENWMFVMQLSDSVVDLVKDPAPPFTEVLMGKG